MNHLLNCSKLLIARKQVDYYTHLQTSLFWTPSLTALVQVICPPCVTLKYFTTPCPSLYKKTWLLYKLCSPFSPNSLSVTGTTKCHKVLILRRSQQNGLQRGNELRKSEKRRSQWLQVEGASRDIGGEWCKRGDSRRG